jgi:transposase
MDDHSFIPQVEVLSVTDSGRRRRWSLAEKVRIVEESLARPRQAASTARRHDISRTLLTRWRKEYREGVLVSPPAPRFAAVTVAPEPRQVPSAAPTAAVAGRETIEIGLLNGRRLTVSSTIDPEALARLLPVLERA